MDKREKEMRTVYEMIHLYCRKIHREKELCPECLGLYEYAKMRIKNVRLWKRKHFVRNARCIVTRRIKGNRFVK